MKLKIKYIKLILILVITNSILSANDGLSLLSLPQSNYYGYCNTGMNPVSESLHSAEKSLFASYTNWLYDTQYTQVAFRKNAIEWSANGLLSDNIDIRGEQPQDDAIGSTEYYNLVLSAGRYFSIKNGELFINASFLYEKLYYKNASGWSIDARYSKSFNTNIRGFTGVTNLGYMNELGNKSTSLPVRIFTGANTFYIPNVELTGLLGADRDAVFYVQAAVGYHYKHIATLSTSYSSYENSWHTGASIHIDKYSIGIGKYFNTAGLEMPLMLSLTLR